MTCGYGVLVFERTVRTGSGSLATRAWLADSGPCVVLVHGSGANLESWNALVRRLVGQHSIVAFDRRGHGRSSDASSYTATELADDIAAVADAYEFGRPIVVGHSAGAWDSLIYATRASLRATICLDQAIASDDPVWADALMLRDDQAESPRSCTSDPGYTDTEWAERMAQGEADLGARTWQETYGPMNHRGAVRGPDGRLHYHPGPQGFRHIQSDWTSFVTAGEPYEHITSPIAVVLARRNTGPIHEALRRLVARRQLETFDADSDHDIHVEQPQLVADLVHRIAQSPE